jgi:hypothetical protein
MPNRSTIPAVLVCLISSAHVPAQTRGAAADPEQPAPFTTLNNAFREAYGKARSRVLASSGPVLIVNGTNFVLLRDGRRVEAKVGSPVYDTVKTIAHLPLAIYLILTPGDGGMDADRLKTLASVRDLIPPVEASLDALGLPAPTLARQRQIMAASAAFIDEAAGKREFRRSLLLAFTREMAPLVMDNVTEATRAQLDATHAQVSAWRRDLSLQEWSRLRVVVIGPHMARDGLAVMQYFLRLLHEPREGGRVVYAESMWDEGKALDLLGTHLLDSSAGEAFFGDSMRMHRDLLGDAASVYLPGLLPE